MRSRGHVVEHLETNKVGITANNDCVFQLGPFKYRILGHYRNYLDSALTEDGDELWVDPDAPILRDDLP